MKLGSLFDGSGGFPLSGYLMGIEPVWAAEVEPYPIAVTKSRFPNMKHLGSVTNVHGGKIEPVDIITFGSPCQDLSVAGKRAGLKHETEGDDETTRSGLFVEAVRIIKEMRDATNGLYPRFAVWENVPGAFSSNGGEDFRTVLEKLIQIAEPSAVMPQVPKGGWAYADSYLGDGWSLSYRTFDAQYWGVPQRRRRIYLVADFRGGCAGEILFKSQGLRGYFEEGRAPWKRTTADVENSFTTNDCTGFDRYNQCATGNVSETLKAPGGGDNYPTVAYTMVVRSGCEVDAKGRADGKGALIQTERASTLSTVQDQYLFQPIGLDRASFNQGKNAQFDFSITEDGTEPTLTARGPGAVCYCLQDKSIGRKEANSCHGLGVSEETSYTLTGIDRHAVAYGFDHGASRDVGDLWFEEQSKTLTNGTCPGHHNGVVTYWDGGQTAGTLTANNAGGNQRMPDKENFNAVIENRSTRYIVRRLTPTECARLQGFPDKWGHPDQTDTFTKEEYEFWLDVRNTHATINGKATKNYTKDQMLSWYNKLHTDGAEYKMWGNGIALPTAMYVMQGIAEVAQ